VSLSRRLSISTLVTVFGPGTFPLFLAEVTDLETKRPLVMNSVNLLNRLFLTSRNSTPCLISKASLSSTTDRTVAYRAQAFPSSFCSRISMPTISIRARIERTLRPPALYTSKNSSALTSRCINPYSKGKLPASCAVGGSKLMVQLSSSAAFGFQREVLSGKWPNIEHRVSEANLAKLDAGE
jgi:hypothetical protein